MTLKLLLKANKRSIQLQKSKLIRYIRCIYAWLVPLTRWIYDTYSRLCITLYIWMTDAENWKADQYLILIRFICTHIQCTCNIQFIFLLFLHVSSNIYFWSVCTRSKRIHYCTQRWIINSYILYRQIKLCH